MTANLLQIPNGTKDILPGEARMKRAMEDRIANNFVAWGYDEAITPTFEYADTFELSGAGAANESMKFLGRDNRTFMLRSEMTTPLARMVVTRMRGDEGSKRLFYIANVFRYEENQAGRQNEFSQAGVELFGDAGPQADAEVLALAVSTLKAAGLEHFILSVGHSGFLAGLIDDAELSPSQKERVKQMILTHNSVALEKAAEVVSYEPVRKVLQQLLYMQGGPDMLRNLKKRMTNPKCIEALDNLLAIFDLCEAYDMTDYINFDLSLVRNFDYYTGMVFEAYGPQIGFNICGGGRYDNMMAKFGKPMPATGFAMGIDRIILSMRREGVFQGKSTWDMFVAWKEGNEKEAIRKAMELRKGGKTVKTATSPMTPEQAAKACEANHCEALVYVR
jgi:ATP phosphoribosyltransferase regulatory subunit